MALSFESVVRFRICHGTSVVGWRRRRREEEEEDERLQCLQAVRADRVEPPPVHNAGARPPRHQAPPPPHSRGGAPAPLQPHRRPPHLPVPPRNAQPSQEACGGGDGGYVQRQEGEGGGPHGPPPADRCQSPSSNAFGCRALRLATQAVSCFRVSGWPQRLLPGCEESAPRIDH